MPSQIDCACADSAAASIAVDAAIIALVLINARRERANRLRQQTTSNPNATRASAPSRHKRYRPDRRALDPKTIGERARSLLQGAERMPLLMKCADSATPGARTVFRPGFSPC